MVIKGLSHLFHVKKLAAQAKHTSRLRTNVYSGLAAAGPPLGPMLGQRNINIANFVREFNERTATMKKGIPLPVRCKATSDKTFDLDIHMPPTTFFIKQAAGLSVGTIKGELAGYITLKHVYEIAKIKLADPPNALKTHQDMCKQVITTAKTCGVKVVRHLDPVEYGKHLQERKQFVQADRAAKQAERESKMLRASE